MIRILDHNPNKMILINFFITENESTNKIALSRHISKKIGLKDDKNVIFRYLKSNFCKYMT
jgi:hypothetical protein